MATHDYSLANQSGASFRTDLNNALAAIVSGNSSGSAPSTTFAYMEWNDTSAGVKKIRNSANTAWIQLFQLDGTLTMEAGATGTPGLAIRGDLNTGIWSSGADLLNFSTGGTERLELGAATVFNDTGADVDFRIEGSTAGNLFYVDAGNNRIGIKTNSPAVLFHLKAANTSSAINNAIRITDSDTGVVADQVCGRIEFETADSNNAGVNAQIDCIYSGNGGGGELQFRTGFAGALKETLRLEDDGDIKVGVGNLSFGTSGKGINFNIGASGSSTSNLLDEYEEGTFTGKLKAGGVVLNSSTGIYTKIGRLVSVQCKWTDIAHGSATSTDTVAMGDDAGDGSLPFAPITNTAYTSVNAMSFNQVTGETGEYVLNSRTRNDSSSVRFTWMASNGTSLENLKVSEVDDGAGDLWVNITYVANA